MWTFAYEGEEAWPTVVEGPGGDVRRFTSRNGLPLSAVDADGVSYRAERDEDGSITAIVDGEDGRRPSVSTAAAPTSGRRRPPGNEPSSNVDNAGRTIGGVTPTGVRAQTNRTRAGRVTSQQAPGRGTTKVRWDPARQVAAITDPTGATTRWTHNLLDQVIDVELPGGGRWGLGYDLAGRVDRVEEPDGGTWRISADGAGSEVEDPGGARHRFDTDPSGMVTALKTPQGRRCELRRHPDRRRTSLRLPSDLEVDADLDEAGGVVSAGPETKRARGATHPPVGWPGAGTATAPAGRGPTTGQGGSEPSTGRAAPPPSSGTCRVGRRTRRTVEYGPDGRPAFFRAEGATTSLTWEPDGRLQRVMHDDGAVETGAWDAAGRLASTTDPLGTTTTFHRDIAGDLVGVTTAMGSTWQYDRDRAGRTSAITDPLGHHAALHRDPNGRLAEVVPASGPVQHFSWDADGGLLTISDSDGPLVTVEHSPDGRLLSAEDRNGRRDWLSWDGMGRPTGAGVDGRVTHLAWDERSTTLAVTKTNGVITDYHTSAEGRLESVEHPDVGTVSARRDADGRLIEVTGRGLLRRWVRDGGGRPITYREEIAGRVSVTELSWDARGRLTGRRATAGAVDIATVS